MKNIQKIIVLIITISFLSCNSTTNKTVEIENSEISKFENIFKDLEKYLTKENGKLWNHQLYGPLLFVNQDNRKIIANEKDTKGILTKNREIYSGILPNEINIANTAFDWNGKRWTMVMLPLPKDYNERLNLLTHEFFHRIQPAIGFAHLYQKDCNHLDNIDGRIYLKLELEALKKALATDNKIQQKKHIKSALLFRAFRHQLFQQSKENENLLEINEGLAEYTGTILSDRNDKDLKTHYIQAIKSLYKNPTFVRSFAYRTIPVYGYYMRQKDETWNLKISKKTNLTDYITEFFNISIPVNLKDSVFQIRDGYNYTQINGFETKRDEKQKEIIAKLDEKFQENPILVIPFQNMSISFNPGNLIPYRDLGTVYPNLRIADNWGILTVEKGALVGKNWGEVIVSEPAKTSDKIIEGDGWKLELNNDWELVKIKENYTLKKK
jgi:flagellin-specific chaperone FliS